MDERPPRRTDLDEFGRRLQEAEKRARQRSGNEPRGGSAQGMGVGLRIAVELAAAVVVGVAIGLGLDRWFGTKPLFLLIFFVVGCAAGFLNVYRTAQELERQRRNPPDESA